MTADTEIAEGLRLGKLVAVGVVTLSAYAEAIMSVSIKF